MNRRDFIRDSALLTAAAGGFMVEELQPEPAHANTAAPAAVNCAVIGLGPRGREITAALAKQDGISVSYVCDSYSVPAFIKHATDIVPQAQAVADYKQVLSSAAVQAVFVATPSHEHKQIVLDALSAGKHVYCEAPLASDLDDAKSIAQAGAAAKTIFQTGLQYRANKQHHHVLGFIRSLALGTICEGRSQWRKKTSWHVVAPTDAREQELNWRLHKSTSSGLPGEVGIHQIDIATWFLNAPPLKVTGHGDIMFWKSEGLEVPDTVQLIFEYPNSVRYIFDGTLVSSFDGASDVFMGSDCSILVRDQRAWMFKEIDSPLLGWEVYARKDKLAIGDEVDGTGVALVADATKLLAQGVQPASVGTDVSQTALFKSVAAFINSVRTGAKPDADAAVGYQATVIARKAHDASMTGSTVVFDPTMFSLT
ncbi:MAG: Gfo/Idh/MocA family oxidoreductase [Armatimonadetes bacterium]|nr:Gfo/Idh/MocA family oxidoreductase [Armatimonadota bacterium]MDE2208064.1 Gfo/Idh/MocA family oxidoreductase [Armatimonadota bacterium]